MPLSMPIKMVTLFSGGNGVQVLFSDTFTITETAPLASPRTAEPGPGTWTIADSNNRLSISSGTLVITGQLSTDEWSMESSTNTLSRGAGFKIRDNADTAVRFGLNASHTQDFVRLVGSAYFECKPGALSTRRALFNNVGDASVPDQKAIVLLGDGDNSRTAVFAKGGAYGTDWTLIMVLRVSSASAIDSVHLHANSSIASSSIDRVVYGQLGGNFAVAQGLCVDSSTSAVSASTSFTCPADFVAEFNVGTISATAKVVKFRIQDASNDWQVTLDSTSTDLDEVVAGTPNQRATMAALNNQTPFVLWAQAQTIGMVGYGNARSEYASAGNFETDTGLEFSSGADLGDIYIYPRTLTPVDEIRLEAL